MNQANLLSYLSSDFFTQENDGEQETVSLERLSELVGISIEHLKSELTLSDDDVSLRDLRQSALEYLDLTFTSFS